MRAIRLKSLVHLRWTLLALVFISVIVASGRPALAAPQAITMTPTSSSPIINPGEVEHGSFRVINQGKTTFKFIVYAAPYKVTGEDYTPDFTVLPSAPNIVSWFNFSEAGGQITPEEDKSISYTITVPDNTQPGGYYAAVFAETQFPKNANGITLNQRVGELFYVQVAGPTVKKGEVLSWQSAFFQKPPLTSVVRIKNDGSIHNSATVRLNVSDVLGHTKYKLTTDKKILPQTIRKITMPWQGTPSIGLFKVSGSVTMLGQTSPLSTKWVLVMSDTVRLVVLAVFVAIVLLIIGRYIHRKRFMSKSKFRHRP